MLGLGLCEGWDVVYPLGVGNPLHTLCLRDVKAATDADCKGLYEFLDDSEHQHDHCDDNSHSFHQLRHPASSGQSLQIFIHLH